MKVRDYFTPFLSVKSLTTLYLIPHFLWITLLNL